MIVEPYPQQVKRWPQSGRHILAHYDDDSVVVYQAYRPEIGHFAVKNGFFGGEFSLNRMSWIKTNFLWMMYRSGWGQKQHQEIILAVKLKRTAFDAILAQAVHASYIPEVYGSEAEWKQQIENSQVRLQWDPDHGPSGVRVERRAIQLGLRGDVLAQYARDWILEIIDMSVFVAEQRNLVQRRDYGRLLVPREIIYPVTDAELASRLGISNYEGKSNN